MDDEPQPTDFGYYGGVLNKNSGGVFKSPLRVTQRPIPFTRLTLSWKEGSTAPYPNFAPY